MRPFIYAVSCIWGTLSSNREPQTVYFTFSFEDMLDDDITGLCNSMESLWWCWVSGGISEQKMLQRLCNHGVVLVGHRTAKQEMLKNMEEKIIR
jgi:hypothetical protein